MRKYIFFFSILFQLQLFGQSQVQVSDTLVTNLNPVIISANRQATLRSEAPISIAQINAKQIADTKANLLTELLNKVPGVVMASFNHEQHTIAIRQPIGLNPYFLFMEDGIPIRPMGIFQNNGLIEINQAAIENIEVIKGPSSSLYGPEAAGGAINFNTLKPSDKKMYSVGYQQDAFGYFQARLTSSAPITKNWGISAALLYAKQKNGWQAASDYDKAGVNIRSDFKLNQKTKLIFAISTNKYTAQAGGSVDSVTFRKRNFISQAPFAYRNINSARARITLESQWNENNFGQIHLIGRVNKIGQFPAYSIARIPGNAAIAKGEINENNFKSIGFIAQNTKTLEGKKIKLITGISADYAPNRYFAYYVKFNRDIKTGVNSVSEKRPDSMLVDYSTKILNLATYAQMDWTINTKLKIVAGGRFDIMIYDFDNYLLTAGTKSAPDEQNNFNRFTPKIGITYQFTNKIGGYLNGSQGFSPPNISQLYRGVKIPTLKAAVFSNYEIGGWASIWSNKLAIEATAYYMPSKNEVVRFANDDGSIENKSAGSAIHKGIEYSITVRPNNQWKLAINGSNARHIFKKFRLSDKLIFDGKEMPQAPHFTGFAEIQYKPNWFKGFRLAAEWQRVGPFFKDNNNTLRYEDKTFGGLKGLSLLHFRTGYQFKKIEIFANLINATDELYTTYISRSATASSFYPAPPRNLTLGIALGF